jgi:hypothetical protein
MEHCKTCKWWKYEEEELFKENHCDDILHPIDPDTDEEMVMPFEVRRCFSPKIVYFERSPDPMGISVKDGSDYFAGLCTGEAFGCINWEKNNV